MRPRIGIRFLRRSAACAAGGTIALLAACDPCAGVAACTSTPRLSVSGQIVDRGNPTDADRAAMSGADIPQAQPVSGVRVQVVPRGGVALTATPPTSTTDGSGWWQITAPAADSGSLVADVIVTPPGSAGYTVRGLVLPTSRTRGQGLVVGRWTRDLYLTLIGEIHDAVSGNGLVGARVTAVRRGGIGIDATANTQSPMTTLAGGRFLYDVRPLADDSLILDFVIQRGALPATTAAGIVVRPKHEWLPPNIDGAVIFRVDSAGRRITSGS